MGINWKRWGAGIVSGGLSEVPGQPVHGLAEQWWTGQSDKNGEFSDPAAAEKANIAQELGKNDYDQNLADSYYQQREGGINDAFYKASRSAAADMGKRGLGNSGMALGGQGDIQFSAAAQKAAARQSAVDAAKAVRRQGLLDQYGVYKDLSDAALEKEKLKAQDDMNSENQYRSLGGLIGGAFI